MFFNFRAPWEQKAPVGVATDTNGLPQEVITQHSIPLSGAPPATKVSGSGVMGFIMNTWRSYQSRLHGTHPGHYIVATLVAILVLAQYLSPLVAELGRISVIAPAALLGMLLGGSIDVSNVKELLVSNAASIMAAVGILTAILFVQNILKIAILLRAIQELSYEKITYSISGIIAPLITVAAWYILMEYQYGPHAIKTYGLIIGSITGAASAVNMMVTGDYTVQTLLRAARVPGILALSCHLMLVGGTYWLIHKYLFRCFAALPVLGAWVVRGLKTARSELAELSPFVIMAVAAITTALILLKWLTPFWITLAVAFTIVGILSEELRWWKSEAEDLEANRIEIGPNEDILRPFTEAEACARRTIRRIRFWFEGALFVGAAVSLTYGHPYVCISLLLTGALTESILLAHNKAMWERVLKDDTQQRPLAYKRHLEEVARKREKGE